MGYSEYDIIISHTVDGWFCYLQHPTLKYSGSTLYLKFNGKFYYYMNSDGGTYFKSRKEAVQALQNVNWD
jgi:hypothetical protein